MDYFMFIVNIIIMILLLVSIFLQDNENVHTIMMGTVGAFFFINLLYSSYYLCKCSTGLFGRNCSK